MAAPREYQHAAGHHYRNIARPPGFRVETCASITTSVICHCSTSQLPRTKLQVRGVLPNLVVNQTFCLARAQQSACSI